MRFEDIVGQSPLIENLKNSLNRGMVVHAYLFSGAKGSGKKALAAILAKALNCRGNGDKPCDLCHSCQKFNTGNHPDVRIIEPQKNSIVIEQIRDMQKDIFVKPYEGGKKVYIIDKAHTMTIQAQNCLLKTLEEPPPFGVIFLLADQLEGLLPTIQSRCRIIRLKRVSREKIKEVLIQRRQVPEDEADLLAALADGLVGRALELSESKEFLEKRKAALDELCDLCGADDASILGHEEFFMREKESIETILDFFESWFRDLLVWKETGEKDLIINRDYENELGTNGKLFTAVAIQDMIRVIALARKQLKSNANYQLTIENLLLNILEVRQK